MYKWPERKNLRMRSFDYNENGYYFVTICTKNRENKFGEIVWKDMVLNEYGEIAFKYFQEIPKHFQNCKIDEFVIIPNHIHWIIILVENADLHSLQDRTKMLLSKIIHWYKSSIKREIRKKYENSEFSWQKSFYDRIIRNEKELLKIREYIEENPLKWHLDKNNLL